MSDDDLSLEELISEYGYACADVITQSEMGGHADMERAEDRVQQLVAQLAARGLTITVRW